MASALLRFLSCLLFTSLLHAGNWATSRVTGSPEPGKPYLTEQVFPEVPLKDPLDMVPLPGTRQCLVAERRGQIWLLPESTAQGEAVLWADLKALHPELNNLYAVQFHPHYAENGYVFITWASWDKLEDGSKLMRYKVQGQGAAARIDPTSAQLLLTWRSGGHNGAALQFGADGMLYLSTGDSEVPSPPDPLHTGQDLGDLLSCILRINVDAPSEGRAYSIPQDNPFLKVPGARGEIWAYGLRNPWKMSFDRATNRLWVGDVGWEQWESIHLVQRGGNYGWSAVEATQQVMPQLKGKEAISPPIVAHSHTEAASITGGYVYRGKRLPGLVGAYVYADYETGKVWALWYDGQRITRHEEIADTPLKIVSFGEDVEGELYLLHYGGEGSIHQLRMNPQAGQSSAFPKKLSETGLFHPDHTPQSGVEPYEIQASMWQDGATAQRWIAHPAGATPGTAKGRKTSWGKDTVLAKTLSLAGKKVETQVLHYDGDSWQGYSYRWNDAGTDAELVSANGAERTVQGQPWRFHSRAECMRCHTQWTGFLMGFQPQQLVAAQRYVEAGIITPEYVKQSTARCVSPTDTAQPLAQRARSWLHANCAHCHRQSGGGSALIWLNVEASEQEMKALGEQPTRGDLGVGKEARIILPGLPGQSVLAHRVARIGTGHMPVLGASEVDTQGLRVLHEWITALAPQNEQAGSVSAAARDWMVRAEGGGPDLEEAFGVIVSSSPAVALEIVHLIDQGLISGAARERTLHSALRSDSVIRELFERYRPASERVPVLGPSPSLEKILAKSGDSSRGAALLTQDGKAASCLACHFVNGTGRDFGPDLSQLGSRAEKQAILQSLLEPSKVIAPGFANVVLTLKDGSVQTGFILKRTADSLHLKLPTAQSLEVKLSSVQTEQTLPISLMPEGLLQNFTAQEAADLLEYLATCRARP